MTSKQAKGIIGRIQEDGVPVIYRFANELPSQSVRAAFGQLAVIAWPYDGSQRNGMPREAANARMIALEKAIEERIESKGECRHAYSRTGNGLKELVYYIADRDGFMEALNDALGDHPRYPIQITFYEDEKWADLRGILELFRNASEGGRSADSSR